MNYYEPVMLLPYVFRMPLVANTTPSYFAFIPWDAEEQGDKFGIAYTTLLSVLMSGYKFR
jgi:hypothetical protein